MRCTSTPGDRSATARLRYCEGQLLRIDADGAAAQEAAGTPRCCRRRSPDSRRRRASTRAGPTRIWRLARTYVYGLDNLDAALTAMREAEQRGYRPGNRELMQLADGYRSRADRMRREAAAADMPRAGARLPQEGGRRLHAGDRHLREGDRVRRGERRHAARAGAPRRRAATTGRAPVAVTRSCTPCRLTTARPRERAAATATTRGGARRRLTELLGLLAASLLTVGRPVAALRRARAGPARRGRRRLPPAASST